MRSRAVHILILAMLVPLAVIAVPSAPDEPRESGTPNSEPLPVAEALTLLNEADAKREGREHFGAIQRYERLLRAERFVAEAQLGIARSYLDLGDLPAARDAAASSVEACELDRHGRPETRERATLLVSEIEFALSRTPEVAVADLRGALEAEGAWTVEVLGHRHLTLREPDGGATSFDLTELSPFASRRVGGPNSNAPYVVTVASPYGASIVRTEDGVETELRRVDLGFANLDVSDRFLDAFERSVRGLTGARPTTLEEEARRVVDALDQKSVCVTAEFRFVGREREHSSYSVATFGASMDGPRTLRIERENEHVVDLDGAAGEARVTWTVDLDRIEWVRVVRVEKREFGSWLVQGAVGDVTFGDLRDEVDVIELGPTTSFSREPSSERGRGTRLLLPAGTDVRAVALSLFNAAQLARR